MGYNIFFLHIFYLKATTVMFSDSFLFIFFFYLRYTLGKKKIA